MQDKFLCLLEDASSIWKHSLILSLQHCRALAILAMHWKVSRTLLPWSMDCSWCASTLATHCSNP